MKKINSFWKLSDWFTKSVNNITVYHNLNELQARKFLFKFSKFYHAFRPKNHGVFNSVEVKYILDRTFEELTNDNIVISIEVKDAIKKVILKKMFFFYPFNYKTIDRLVQLCHE